MHNFESPLKQNWMNFSEMFRMTDLQSILFEFKESYVIFYRAGDVFLLPKPYHLFPTIKIIARLF